MGDPGRQQLVFSFTVPNPAQCTNVVYLDAGLTIKADDTNNAIFAGSENCNRPYNIVNGKQVTAVMGRRTSEVGLDGKLHSRSLQTATTYRVTIIDTLNSSGSGFVATTANIPFGDTHVEEPPYSATGFNHWAYPDLDWTDAGQNTQYVDPLTGVGFQRGPRQVQDNSGATTEVPFTKVFDLNSAWTNPNNALSTSSAGPFAAYTGTARDPLYFALDSNNGAFDWFSPFMSDNKQGHVVEDLNAVLYGSAPGCTGEDCKVLVCLATNYTPTGNTCTSPELEAILPTSAGRVMVTRSPAYPVYQFAGWNVGRALNAQEIGIPIGNATVAGSVVTLTSGYLPLNTPVGTKIRIGASWYTIGTLGSATSFTLAESSITTSGTWALGNFGFRVRKKTVTANAINVAMVYEAAYAMNTSMGPNGAGDYCSNNTFTINFAADGTTALSPPKQGRMCLSGTVNNSLFLLADDGEVRVISTFVHADNSGTGTTSQIPLNVFHLTDPYTLYAMHTDNIASLNKYVFFSVTYDPSVCHFRAYTGNVYATVSAPSDCMTWTQHGTNASNNTITQLFSAAAVANVMYDATSLTGGLNFSGVVGGRWAMINQNFNSQDNLCYEAVFDLTTYTMVKFWDSMSGSLPGFRWGGCHSSGLYASDGGQWGQVVFEPLYARSGTGYGSGPYLIRPATAKSFDGTTWNSDTSLAAGTIVTTGTSGCTANGITSPTVVDAGHCVDQTNVAAHCPNGFGVPGTANVCVWLKLPSKIPCSINASAREISLFPCPWNGAYASTGNLVLQPGDYMSNLSSHPGSGTPGDINFDGKNEKWKILSLVTDGGTGWIALVQRFAACDNETSNYLDALNPAVLQYEHLYVGSAGAKWANGWNGVASATAGCSGANIWQDLSLAIGSTVAVSDNTQVNQSHNALGINVTGLGRAQVGAQAARSGVIPAVLGSAPDTTWADNIGFGGVVQISNGLEQYPSLSNWNAVTRQQRLLSWDQRAINPNTGSNPGDLVGAWAHTYALTSGQTFTYKVSPPYLLTSTADFKVRKPNVFGTGGAFKDISGPSSAISDATPWSSCTAYKVNECVSGSAVGDVFASGPNLHVGPGQCFTDTYAAASLCVNQLASQAGWMTERFSNLNDSRGVLFRRITMGLTGPAMQFQYSSPHMAPDGKYAMVRTGYPNGVRQDVLLYKMPPPVQPDSIDRSNFIGIPIQLPSGSGFSRVRFGYAENGTASQYYCTSRQEACVTDASISPFAYAVSDTLTAVNCSSGCTISVPALPGRVVYFSIERSATGSGSWISGDVQVRAIQ